MSISAEQAAKAIWTIRDGDVTNLELQKLLYLAHMMHRGGHGIDLVEERFQAWDYGPVLPALYHRLKGYGDRPIAEGAFWGVPMLNHASPEFVTITDVIRRTRDFTPGQLVSLTHDEKGAWGKAYSTASRNVVIPTSLIDAEYQARVG